MKTSHLTAAGGTKPLLPSRAAILWRAVPIRLLETGAYLVLMENPDNEEQCRNLEVYLGGPISIQKISSDEWMHEFENVYGFGAQHLEFLKEAQDKEISLTPPDVREVGIAAYVNDLLREALEARATDIHIEPNEEDLFIRFRIDGLLHPIFVPSNLRSVRQLLISRIKVLAQLNIAEHRLPQDGRFFRDINDQEIDIRVSTLPTLHGEGMDLRLLPRQRMGLDLEHLGMGPNFINPLEKIIRKPHGIILVTGPTGHGKTTTLYACLSRINTPDKKIITLEDPVEYRLRGVSQIQLQQKLNFGFADGLRSILRHDPDVIMVGEVRDQETADVAIRSALTGHLVFSTLHTNDAVSAIARLVDMGVEPYLLASSLTAVLAQRLVRVFCSFCRGNGNKNCEPCRGTGFLGRTGIFELLLINDDVRELIQKKSPTSVIRKKARSHGMMSLYEDGVFKVDQGLTSLQEIQRVTEEYS
jgi:type II secretory ATPase GspE/PulE/Tfp pilus assembly ATPase PilB-like protein